MIQKKDIILGSEILNAADLDIAVRNANLVCKTLKDRPDLHERDYLEQFENALMGELAELLVKKYLEKVGYTVESTVDKSSGQPDAGVDLSMVNPRTLEVERISVKSSLSYNYSPSDEKFYLKFNLSSKPGELIDLNIQVMF